MILNSCSNYCLIISLAGWIILLGLGISVSIDYPYNHLENSSKTGTACYVASAIYAVFPIFYFYKQYKSSRTQINSQYQRIPSSPQEMELNEMRRSSNSDG